MEPKDAAQEILYETLDYLIMLTIRSLTNQQKELFDAQVTLFFNALTEVDEADYVLDHFTIRFSQEMTKLREYSSLFDVFKQNLPYLFS